MGQAASYAESSVQRALLKLKHEEQAEEDELLEACGFRRPTATTVPDDARPAQSPVRGHDESGGMTSSNNPNGNNTDAGSCERLLSSPLPPPPACLAPFVSLAPKYYTLDELRDALRYLPDTLWVSLYRVSLLYILDNDHDGRVNSTDISFFMDWGIKTVGHQVPPEQLAEVLQTYAALHCWHRCLHVGEEIEAERAAAAAAAAAAQSSRGGPGGGSGVAARSRRRPLQSVSGGGSSGSAPSHYHNHQQAQSVASFMLLHLREAFFRNRAGGQVPRPSSVQARAPDNDNATTTSTTCTSGAAAGAATEAGATEAGAAGGDGGRSCPAAPQFFSPRSAVTQPVTSATRLEAAAHFAEWMLRLVQNQERDRRHERQRLERRLRWLLAPEAKLNNNNILRHSQLLQHRSVRLRGGSLAMLSSLGDTGDGEDVVTSQPFLPPLRSGVVDMYDVTDAEVVDSDVVVELPRNSSNFAFPSQVASPAAAAEGDGVSAPSSRSVTPLESTSALIKTQHDGVDGGSIDRQTNAPVVQLRDSPNDTTPSPQQQQQRPSSCPVAAAAAATTTPTTTAAAGLARSTDHVLTGSHVPRDSGACNHHSSSSGGGAPGTAAIDGQTTSLNWYMAAAAANSAPAFTPDQLAAVLMDAEAFYVELEKNGWCTIGAVEEAYLDFAVEDSYCLSFWAFCRLLNEASADEVEAALDLTTAQATAVLTSAVAVEEHRRAAAARQLQRLRVSPQHTSSPPSGWARQVEVVPMFLVSEYTFITFISAFIHAYWDMLESMGVDAVTQPVEMVAELTARSTTTTSPTHGSGVYEERGRGTAHQ